MSAKKVSKDTVLSIDAGTQSIRIALIDFKGNILKIAKTEIEPFYSKNPGWAEQDPEYFWKILSQTSKQLFRDNLIQKDSIKGLTITTQRNTMINLDKDKKILRPAMVWVDRRKAELGSWPPFYLSSVLKGMNIYDLIVYSIRECEANWLAQNQPEIWEKTDKFLFL